jgi:hypothetical protein
MKGFLGFLEFFEPKRRFSVLFLLFSYFYFDSDSDSDSDSVHSIQYGILYNSY